MRAIATQCGMSPTELYRHFPNKEAIVAAICTHGTQQLGLWLCGDTGHTNPSGLEHMCRQYFAFASERPWLYRMMFRSARIGRRHPAIDAFVDRARRFFGGDPDASGRAGHLWMAMHGLAAVAGNLGEPNEDRADTSTSIDDLVGAYIRAVVRGL